MATQPILIVDDDPGFRELLAEVLAEEGYTPVPAAPADALAAAARERPAMALLDAQMPGIDGPSLCRRLRAWPRTQDIPIVFITGIAREALASRLADCDSWSFLAKPCSLDDLLDIVMQHLPANAATPLAT